MTKDIAILRADPEGVGPTSHLTALFDPATVGAALFDHGWSSGEAVEVLTSIARDAVNNTARERLAAIKYLEDKAEKVLTLAGTIRRISMEAFQEDGGTKKKLTADGLQLIKEGAARTLSTLALLEAGTQTTDIIDVDPKESHDARTDADDAAPKPSGANSGTGPDQRGSVPDSELYGQERPSSAHPEGHGQSYDENPIQGTDDERISRTPIQSGRGGPSNGSRAEGPECGPQVGPDPRGTRRTTPYTPGEARRRTIAAAAIANDPSSTPSPPNISTPRQSDGPDDIGSHTPRIAARLLDPALAATGFPGDASSD